jgi:hypothetical protein
VAAVLEDLDAVDRRRALFDHAMYAGLLIHCVVMATFVLQSATPMSRRSMPSGRRGNGRLSVVQVILPKSTKR